MPSAVRPIHCSKSCDFHTATKAGIWASERVDQRHNYRRCSTTRTVSWTEAYSLPFGTAVASYSSTLSTCMRRSSPSDSATSASVEPACRAVPGTERRCQWWRCLGCHCRLSYTRFNQSSMHAELYQGLSDAVSGGDGSGASRPPDRPPGIIHRKSALDASELPGCNGHREKIRET